MFDCYDETGAGQDFDPFAAEYVSRSDWGDQGYLRDHVHAIALRVREVLQRQEEAGKEG